jgi:hypothetical protein
MVTPLRDGMNLIAKEYVAAQDAADPGVLILSRFAGAAEEMPEALIVNPYSIEETANAIKDALEMTLAERSERHDALLAGVNKHSAAAWSESFLEHLKRVRPNNEIWFIAGAQRAVEGSTSTALPWQTTLRGCSQPLLAHSVGYAPSDDCFGLTADVRRAKLLTDGVEKRLEGGREPW